MTETPTWLTMNDGVRLDASVCTPGGPVPAAGWPTVLLVHGHGEDGSKAMTLDRGRRYAGRGYQAVCYSVRGQGGSEGLSFHLGARELFDLQAVIDWILAELPVDRLAVCGSSQGGWHSWMAASFHPRVATVVPENIFLDYADFAVPNGALSRWFMTKTMRRRVMSAGLQDLARQWAIEGEWDRLREWLRPMSPSLWLEKIRCPVMIVHGWHDAGMPADEVLAAFDRLTVPKLLYLGGGGHEGKDGGTAVDLRTGLVDRWLDHWLRDVDTGLLAEPAIRYAERPGWQHFATDRFEATERTLYLREGGVLAAEAPTRPAANANLHNVVLDPAYTLQTAVYRDMAGTSEALAHEAVAWEGEALDSELALLGAPRFTLHMLPQRAFFQVHAQLWDVAPDGGAELISRGHFGTRTATPGRHVMVEIEGRPIAWRVAAGHRLRVVVCNFDTTYCFPIYEPYSARIYQEAERASMVRVPVAG